MTNQTMDSKRMLELRGMIGGREVKEAHRLLRLVGGLGRFRILALLKASRGPLNVTEISKVLHASCSAVSHELRLLKRRGLVTSSSQGREVFYRISVVQDGLLPRL